MKFNKFNDIDHRPLRIFNRAAMFYNILEDQGKATAEEYAQSFTKEERFEMAQMSALVKKQGPKAVRALVTAGLEFVDEGFKDEA